MYDNKQIIVVDTNRGQSQLIVDSVKSVVGNNVQFFSEISQVYNCVRHQRSTFLIVNIGLQTEAEFELIRCLYNTCSKLYVVLLLKEDNIFSNVFSSPKIYQPFTQENLTDVVTDALKDEEHANNILPSIIIGYTCFNYSGVVTVASEKDTGKLGFMDGHIVYAKTQHHVGNEALISILTWDKANVSRINSDYLGTNLESSDVKKIIELILDTEQFEMKQASLLPVTLLENSSQYEVKEVASDNSEILTQILMDTLLDFDEMPLSFEPISVDEFTDSDIIKARGSTSFDENTLQDKPTSLDLSSQEKEPLIRSETNLEDEIMSENINSALEKLSTLSGYVGVALVDSKSGMMLGRHGGGGGINLEVAAAANSEVVKSKRQAIKMLKLKEDIEDILITLDSQYHLIRPFRRRPYLFFYLVLDRNRSNLALARMELGDVEENLEL